MAGICENDDDNSTEADLPRTFVINVFTGFWFKISYVYPITRRNLVHRVQYKLLLYSHLSKNIKGLVISCLHTIPSCRFPPISCNPFLQLPHALHKSTFLHPHPSTQSLSHNRALYYTLGGTNSHNNDILVLT
jgi:hypothetical protein